MTNPDVGGQPHLSSDPWDGPSPAKWLPIGEEVGDWDFFEADAPFQPAGIVWVRRADARTTDIAAPEVALDVAVSCYAELHPEQVEHRRRLDKRTAPRPEPVPKAESTPEQKPEPEQHKGREYWLEQDHRRQLRWLAHRYEHDPKGLAKALGREDARAAQRQRRAARGRALFASSPAGGYVNGLLGAERGFYGKAS